VEESGNWDLSSVRSTLGSSERKAGEEGMNGKNGKNIAGEGGMNGKNIKQKGG
jgi:hypothetical protein